MNLCKMLRYKVTKIKWKTKYLKINNKNESFKNSDITTTNFTELVSQSGVLWYKATKIRWKKSYSKMNKNFSSKNLSCYY